MALVNLGKQEDAASKSTALKYRIYVAPMSSVNVDNFPKAKGSTISTNPLLPNATLKYFDAKINTIKPNAVPGESPYNGVITLSPSIEGISKETLAWVYANVAQDFLVIWERCSDGQRFIAGDPCSGGLKFAYTSIGELEGGIAGIATTFTGGECPAPYYFYDGPLPLEAPVNIAVDATTVALTDKFQYQLPENTKAVTLTSISNVTDSDVGRIIEFVGSGNNYPTLITSSASFILNNGVDFSATSGNRISFQITRTGNNTYSFFEVWR